MKNRILKKVFSLLIIFLIIIPYLFPLSKSIGVKSRYSKYVAVGDSIAYGYGLENKDVDSYAAKVRDYYEISSSNFQNKAVSGMTCAQFYDIIQTAEYTDVIKDADMLTVSIGSNELLGLATQAVADVTGVQKGDPQFAEKTLEVFKNASLTEKATMSKQIYDFFTSNETKEKIDAAILQYQEKWTKSVEYIYSINPDIVFVATEFYNPYYEIELLNYDLGGFIDESIQRLNKILWDTSNSEQKYRIAKIYDAFNTTDPRITNVNVSLLNGGFNIDPHPNVAGHEVIYTKVIDELALTQDSQEPQKKDISTLTISDIADKPYTGQAIEPEIKIKDGTKDLVKDLDFNVIYQNNIEVGQATATIMGIGDYEGRVEKTFNIVEVKTRKDISNVTIEDIDKQVYTGYAIKPTVVIKDGENVLTENTDYELKYTENIDVGQATVNITGIGNYEGEISKNFEIGPKNIGETSIKDIGNFEYTGNEIIPELEVSNGSYKLVKDKDYTVNYKNNIEVGTATATIDGKGNFNGSVSKNFEITVKSQPTKKDISKLEFSNIIDKTYSGKSLTPEVIIKDGEYVLEKEKDYLISYNNNINVGTGNIIITGMGEYTGTSNLTFKILAKDIKFIKLADIENQVYTGKEIKPEVVVSSDEIVLKENTDYTITYKNNIQVGTASIEINGIGNYTGTITKTFNIIRMTNDGKDDGKDDDNKPANNSNNVVDNTIANVNIPQTGERIFMILSIGTVITISIVLYTKVREMHF